MRYQHLCSAHVLEIQLHEMSALAFWSRAMHQGISLYAHCRWDCASSYLATAFEIASIRLEGRNNSHFGALHALKPLEFLLEVYAQCNNRSAAEALLNQAEGLVTEFAQAERGEMAGALNQLAKKLAPAQALQAQPQALH